MHDRVDTRVSVCRGPGAAHRHLEDIVPTSGGDWPRPWGGGRERGQCQWIHGHQEWATCNTGGTLGRYILPIRGCTACMT